MRGVSGGCAPKQPPRLSPPRHLAPAHLERLALRGTSCAAESAGGRTVHSFGPAFRHAWPSRKGRVDCTMWKLRHARFSHRYLRATARSMARSPRSPPGSIARRDLAVRTAAHLAHAFDYQVEAMNIGLGKASSRRIQRQPAAGPFELPSATKSLASPRPKSQSPPAPAEPGDMKAS